jgi:hypothetical protein
MTTESYARLLAFLHPIAGKSYDEATRIYFAMLSEPINL